MSVISCGTKRWVIASVDIPSADSCRMSLPVSRVIGVSAPGLGGIVVLRSRGVVAIGMLPAGFVTGGQKCFQIGHSTEVDVCPCAVLWFPCAMHRKHDGGQLQLRPLCQLDMGQLK